MIPSLSVAVALALGVGAADSNVIVARIDGKGQVTVNEDVVLKDVNKTYSICPTYSGGRDWPMGAYNPKTNTMFMQLSNSCIDTTTRTDRGTAGS